jgi:hypothetical protein
VNWTSLNAQLMFAKSLRSTLTEVELKNEWAKITI